MIARRSLVKAGAAAVGLVAALPAGRALAARPETPSTAAEPFTVPLRVPLPLRPLRAKGTDYYRLTAREADVSVLPGTTTRIRGFAGQLSPLIVARRGRPVTIEQVNELDVPVAVHLHGGHVPASSDGHPMDEIGPGRRRRYSYPNTQRAATLWLHDHSHHDHVENIYRGLAATYILTDDFEDGLPLPKGQYDVTLQLRDAKFDADGGLVYHLEGFRDRHTILVNGCPRPYYEVAARKYRFRLVNTSNERAFVLRLEDGGQLVHIGSDGGLLPAAVPTPAVVSWPGERQEVVIDFSRYPVGTGLVLQNAAAFPGEAPEVMRFDVVRTAEDGSSVPGQLRPVEELGEPAVEREFVLHFDRKSGHHLINGKVFDMDRVDIRPKLGTTEVWTIKNIDAELGIPHSLHPHLEHFRVLDRDGQPPPPGEAGMKDTIAVQAGRSARILMAFRDYPGRFMYHCHMLGHIQLGMMGQMEVHP